MFGDYTPNLRKCKDCLNRWQGSSAGLLTTMHNSSVKSKLTDLTFETIHRQIFANKKLSLTNIAMQFRLPIHEMRAYLLSFGLTIQELIQISPESMQEAMGDDYSKKWDPSSAATFIAPLSELKKSLPIEYNVQKNIKPKRRIQPSVSNEPPLVPPAVIDLVVDELPLPLPAIHPQEHMPFIPQPFLPQSLYSMPQTPIYPQGYMPLGPQVLYPMPFFEPAWRFVASLPPVLPPPSMMIPFLQENKNFTSENTPTLMKRRISNDLFEVFEEEENPYSPKRRPSKPFVDTATSFSFFSKKGGAQEKYLEEHLSFEQESTAPNFEL